MPTVSYSMLNSSMYLQVPPCLIIQMPRFGKAYKMYPRILPSQLLDITDVIESCPRQCIVCGKLARFECRECFGQCGPGLESIAFCEPCLETVSKGSPAYLKYNSSLFFYFNNAYHIIMFLHEQHISLYVLTITRNTVSGKVDSGKQPYRCFCCKTSHYC
jgi:hypothetical protein